MRIIYYILLLFVFIHGIAQSKTIMNNDDNPDEDKSFHALQELVYDYNFIARQTPNFDQSNQYVYMYVTYLAEVDPADKIHRTLQFKTDLNELDLMLYNYNKDLRTIRFSEAGRSDYIYPSPNHNCVFVGANKEYILIYRMLISKENNLGLEMGYLTPNDIQQQCYDN